MPRVPELGLVCLSSDEHVSFRAMTRKRFLETPEAQREHLLHELYFANIQRLHTALGYCHRRKINLYRMTSSLFPMSDEPLGEAVLRSLAATLSSVGRRAERLGIRVVIHPDQFVVLNSESHATGAVSRLILDKHALSMDLMGLARSPWNLMNIHGGKSGRSAELIDIIRQLPDPVKSRLTLENDEYSFSAAEIYAICRQTGVPMVFDCHHHVIKEQLGDYDHPSVEHFTKLAAETWPKRAWQLAHVSNGDSAFLDRYHGRFVTMMPKAFAAVPWIEVEARGKELAIAALREKWPASGKRKRGTLLKKLTKTEEREKESRTK